VFTITEIRNPKRFGNALDLVGPFHAPGPFQMRRGRNELQRSQPLAQTLPRIMRQPALIDADGSLMDHQPSERKLQRFGGADRVCAHDRPAEPDLRCRRLRHTRPEITEAPEVVDNGAVCGDTGDIGRWHHESDAVTREYAESHGGEDGVPETSQIGDVFRGSRDEAADARAVEGRRQSLSLMGIHVMRRSVGRVVVVDSTLPGTSISTWNRVEYDGP
jgi:hypothetical protein